MIWKIENSEISTQLNNLLVMRKGRIFLGCKCSNIDRFFKMGNINLPGIFFTSIRNNTIVTTFGLVLIMLISRILKLTNNSKIAFSVVESLMVNMVYLAIGREAHYQLMEHHRPSFAWANSPRVSSEIPCSIPFRCAGNAPSKVFYSWIIFSVKIAKKSFTLCENLYRHGLTVNFNILIRAMFEFHKKFYTAKLSKVLFQFGGSV